jgi:hypothetical protein
MSITIPTVQPGDLIKADAWNNLVQQLIKLDARLTALESITPGSGSKFAITSLSQTSLNVNDPLTVYGLNFGATLLDIVMLNGFTVPAGNYILGQSSDRQLTFTVPNVPNIPPGGTNVNLTIQTPNGIDQRTFLLSPQTSTIVTGTLIVSLDHWENATSPIAANATSYAVFNVKSVTSIAATFVVTPTTTIPGATASLVDSTGKATSTNVPLQPMAATDPGVSVRVALAVPNGASGAGSVALQVASADNRVVGASGDETFTVGLPPPQPGTISFKDLSFRPTTAVLDSTGALAVPAGVTVGVTMTPLLPAGAPLGTYSLTGPTLPIGTAGWTAALAAGNTTTVSAGSPNPTTPAVGFTITGVSGATPTTVLFGIQAPSGTPFGQLTLRVKTA